MGMRYRDKKSRTKKVYDIDRKIREKALSVDYCLNQKSGWLVSRHFICSLENESHLQRKNGEREKKKKNERAETNLWSIHARTTVLAPWRRAFLHSKWPTAGGTADGIYPWVWGSSTFPTLLPGQGIVSSTFGCNRFIPGFATIVS